MKTIPLASKKIMCQITFFTELGLLAGSKNSCVGPVCDIIASHLQGWGFGNRAPAAVA